MKTNNILVILLIALLYSCGGAKREQIAKFDVINMTGDKIDSLSVQIKGNAVENWFQLDAGDKRAFELDFTGIEGDGAYTIKYRKDRDTSMRSEDFGYFTNGTPDQKKMVIKILPYKIDITLIDRSTIR